MSPSDIAIEHRPPKNIHRKQRPKPLPPSRTPPPLPLLPNRTSLRQPRMRIRKRDPQAPIPQIPQMPLKHRIDAQLLRPRHRQQRIAGLVRPVHGERGGVGDEEFVEGDGREGGDEGFAHEGEGEVVDPGGMGG